ALRIDRLIRGNGVQPRPNRSSRLELLALQVHLQKRRLERVFGHFRVAQIPPQVAIQLAFVATDQLRKQSWITRLAIAQQQLLVGSRGWLRGPGLRQWQRGFHRFLRTGERLVHPSRKGSLPRQSAQAPKWAGPFILALKVQKVRQSSPHAPRE